MKCYKCQPESDNKDHIIKVSMKTNCEDCGAFSRCYEEHEAKEYFKLNK